MRIDSDLTQLNNISFGNNQVTKEVNANGNLFDTFYQSALSVLGETNKLQIESDILQQNFAAGRTDNILSVVMAQEKATTSLNFTVQVANKVIEAYREIMRMQI